jgi:hypothetical protein
LNFGGVGGAEIAPEDAVGPGLRASTVSEELWTGYNGKPTQAVMGISDFSNGAELCERRKMVPRNWSEKEKEKRQNSNKKAEWAQLTMNG